MLQPLTDPSSALVVAKALDTHRSINAVAESFFATPKRQLAGRADWHTRDEARTTVFEYIEGVVQSAATALELGVPEPHRLRTAARVRAGLHESSVNHLSTFSREVHYQTVWSKALASRYRLTRAAPKPSH